MAALSPWCLEQIRITNLIFEGIDTQKNVLYYPHIGLRNASLTKALALFYDHVYRIVPDNVIPDDNEELQPLLEEGSVGKMIDPAPYSQSASDEFPGKLGEWDASALDGDPEDRQEISRLHVDKTDQRVRKLFEESGFQSDNDWVSVPVEIASIYMLYLSTVIAKKNNLSLITGDWGAWTGTSYFNLDGQIDHSLTHDMLSEYVDDPFGLFCLLVSEITPTNISEIPADKILAFRLKRSDEITNFRKCLNDLHEELKIINANEIKIDAINAKVKALAKAKSDYQDASDLIKVKGWTGVKMIGFPAPAIFGHLMEIPTASTVVLGATGLALGALFTIKSNVQDLKKLNRDNPASLLIEMDRSFKNYTSSRGGGDMNYHAWNCMEEFVND